MLRIPLIVISLAYIIATIYIVILKSRLKKLGAELDEIKNHKAPPRKYEDRRKHFGSLWFPVLTLDDENKVVLEVSVGLPHCPNCVRPLEFQSGTPEQWHCRNCKETRPNSTTDLVVTDTVYSEALKEFLTKNPGWRPAPTLKPIKQAPLIP